MLIDVWGDDERAVAAIGELRRDLIARLAAMPAHPPLTTEMDAGDVSSADAALDLTVRGLLHLEDEGGLTGPGSAERLRHLVAEPAVRSDFGPLLAATVAAG